MRLLILLLLLVFTAIGALGQPPAAPDKKAPQDKKGGKGGPKTKSWDEVADAAANYLKGAQAEDGSWSKSTHPGITGVVLTGLFLSGKAAAGDPVGSRGLKFVESMADAKEGHLAAGDAIRHKFYMTSVNLQALQASGDKKYEPAVRAAVGYLRGGQVGGEDKKPQSDGNFGGFGYGPGTRGDLSNPHMALDAVTAAGAPKDDPIFKRAVVFVGRMQNFKGEFNDQPWAGKIDDGSFIYVLPQAGATGDPADPRPGYGSMTYAGLKALAHCGVSRDDPRVKKGLEWVAKNYSVDLNPGRQEGAGGQGYYYYLVAMARCFTALGLDEVTDAAGKTHDWRADITRALANRQKPNGSWASEFSLWMEANPDLDTAYALIALSYTKPKSK